MTDQPSPTGGAGCGLLGCLGGIFLGLATGALLVMVTALLAATGQVPTAIPPEPAPPAIKISLTEEFLNRFMEQPQTGSIQIDVQPGNRVQVNANTVADVLGMPVPVQVAGLFEIQVNQAALQVNLLDTQVFGLDIPLTGIFDTDITQVNQNLATMLQDISQTLNAPVQVTGLSTTDTLIEMDMQEAQ